MGPGREQTEVTSLSLGRRDLLRRSALALLGLPVSRLVASCGNAKAPRVAASTSAPTESPTTIAAASATTVEPSTTATTTAAPVTTTPTEAVVEDVTKPWWLRGNFAPVSAEVEAFDLSIEGALPPELSGVYLRNGSNPAAANSPHWFFGDGMVHGLRLDRGKVSWYRNRYVQTSMYTARHGFGQGPPGGAANQANVSVIWHANRLLTSGEVGFPHQLSPTDLSTKGVFDFDGKLTSAFTAHPKIDPSTGNLHSFGYGFVPPFLTYNVMSPEGTIVHSEPVDLPRSTMIHDFAITEKDVIFWDLPVVFDLTAAPKWIAAGGVGAIPYSWQPDAGARVGIMPLGGPASAMVWFDIEPCYVFHGLNAFRIGNRVVVDVCRLSSMFVPGQTLGGDLTLRRWTFDLSTRTARDEIVDAPAVGDLPTRDPRRVGRAYDHAYLVQTRNRNQLVEFGGLVKHNVTTGRQESWDPGPTKRSNEWLFVPGASQADDDGWLLSFVHDVVTNRSEFVVIDAQAVGKGPIARVALPQRVPFGFHGTFVPSQA